MGLVVVVRMQVGSNQELGLKRAFELSIRVSFWFPGALDKFWESVVVKIS